MARVCSPGSRLVLIVGRLSRVLGTALHNRLYATCMAITLGYIGNNKIVEDVSVPHPAQQRRMGHQLTKLPETAMFVRVAVLCSTIGLVESGVCAVSCHPVKPFEAKLRVVKPCEAGSPLAGPMVHRCFPADRARAAVARKLVARSPGGFHGPPRCKMTRLCRSRPPVLCDRFDVHRFPVHGSGHS